MKRKPEHRGPVVKSLVMFMGALAAAAGGLASLFFGVGFLAIRQHNEMLGLPMTTLSAGAYVRSGGLFFKDSVYHTVQVLPELLWVVLIVAVPAALYVSVLPLRRRIERFLHGELSRNTAALALALILLLGAMYLVSIQFGVLGPSNTKLLHEVSDHWRNQLIEGSGDEEVASGAELPAKKQSEAARSAEEPRKAGGGWLSGPRQRASRRTRAALLQRDGIETLRRDYGRDLFWTALVAVAAGLLLRREVIRLGSDAQAPTDGEAGFRTLVRGSRTLAVALLTPLAALAMLNLPAVYGVRCLANDALEVEVETSRQGPVRVGYLLTDLSSEPEEVWILGTERLMLSLRRYPREEIRAIHLTGNYNPNVLALSPDTAADSAP